MRALVSGISRGTESLVFHGRVPESEWARMRCPFQEGDFPFPVKYGYAMVGVLEDEPGPRFFALYPHQSRFVVPKDWAVPVPAEVSDERAVLAPQMETALNATWDSGPRIGDRIAVVGGGVIGCLTAYLCSRIAGTEVTLIDIDPSRRAVADALGITFATPDGPLPENCDLVFHASGKSDGLYRALGLAGFEATIVELSWYGTNPVNVPLGGAFHSQRLTLLSSQVGNVAPARRPRWPHNRRLAKALSLCADPALDCLVSDETPFADLPQKLPSILGAPGALCHLVRY
ncbi:MAG TPA: zinc-binding alcohol dehydrogenase [Alphaproteobacteria bacterium]|jgi:threonine dehydrogenase-like Zn-dependent dehydrogenase|nr:zinc-binding alcohol dehydrogenase [Alphaproteobacteria bacterium]